MHLNSSIAIAVSIMIIGMPTPSPTPRATLPLVSSPPLSCWALRERMGEIVDVDRVGAGKLVVGKITVVLIVVVTGSREL